MSRERYDYLKNSLCFSFNNNAIEFLLSFNFIFQVGFDTFKEGFVAVLSETVEGMSSEDDLDEETDLGTTGILHFKSHVHASATDAVTGLYYVFCAKYAGCRLGGSLSPKYLRRRRLARRAGLDSTISDLDGTTDFSEHTSSSRLSTAALGKTGSRLPSLDHDDVSHSTGHVT